MNFLDKYIKESKKDENLLNIKEFSFDFKELKNSNKSFLMFFIALDLYFKKCILYERIINDSEYSLDNVIKKHLYPKIIKFRKELKKVTQ